jgi:hypothetical protein
MFKNFPTIAARHAGPGADLEPDGFETLAHVTFRALIGALGLLLILLFSGPPVVGS